MNNLKIIALLAKASYNLVHELLTIKWLFHYFTDKIAITMQLNEKLRFIRHIKKWSQEEIAHRLNMSPSAYGSVERGETKLSFQRLEEIAKIFDVELSDLIDLNTESIFNNFGGTNSNCHTWYNNPSSEQLLELQNALKQAHLEIDYLKQQNADLREMVNLLKNNSNS